jgi:phosphatidylinositol alpha-1,6-mannosyltransferase
MSAPTSLSEQPLAAHNESRPCTATTLLVSDIFPPVHGGSGRWFWEIYRRLPRPDYVIAAGQHPRQEEFDATHDLRVRRLPLRLAAWGLRSWTGLRGYLGTARRLCRLMKEEHVGMVHCGRCLPEGFAVWLASWWTGVGYACYVHGEDVTTAATSRELSWMVKRVLHGARFLIANSHSTRTILLQDWKLPEERVHLLYPGVDTRRFIPAPRDLATRTELGWGNRPVVLTVGRLQKRKGHDQMIRALPTIRRRVPDVLYAIVGDGEERANLDRLVSEHAVHEHIQFLGEVDDVRLIRCYQQCDLFVLPNRQEGSDIEGFGMVLLEAQACGRPGVAGASGGTAETMRLGETGLVVPCDGPDELARVVPELLCRPDELARMGEAGRRWVVDEFDWESLTRRAGELFTRGMRR